MEHAKKVLQNFWKISKYVKKIDQKNEENPSSTCLKPILRLIPGTHENMLHKFLHMCSDI